MLMPIQSSGPLVEGDGRHRFFFAVSSAFSLAGQREEGRAWVFRPWKAHRRGGPGEHSSGAFRPTPPAGPWAAAVLSSQEMSQKMVEALKKSGGNPRFTVYPEAGHDSWTEAYNDPRLYEWLLQQKRGDG